MPGQGPWQGVLPRSGTSRQCWPPTHVPLPCRLPFAMTRWVTGALPCHGDTTASKERGESCFHPALPARPWALSCARGHVGTDRAGLRAPPGWL